MSDEINAGSSEPVTGTAIAPAAAVAGAELATSDKVVVTHVQTEVEQREAADKALNADLMKVYQKLHQPRAEDGKFASTEPKAEETPEGAETAATEPETTDQASTAKDEPAKPAIDPPLSWSADMKAKWAALPPELQTYVAQRDKETHEAITRTGQQVKEHEQKIKSYEPLDKVATRYQDLFAKTGMSPAGAFAEAMELHTQFNQNPVSVLLHLGQRAGIDLRPFFQHQGIQQQAPVVDPRIAQLEAQLNEVKGKLTAQESEKVEQQQAAEQATQASLLKTIDDFKKDKPYFDDVKPVMATLLQGGVAATLDEAYEMAVHAKPEVRTRIQTDQRKAEEDKRRQDAEAKAKAAKAAAVVNVKSGSPGTQSPQSMDDTLKALATKHYGRSAA